MVISIFWMRIVKKKSSVTAQGHLAVCNMCRLGLELCMFNKNTLTILMHAFGRKLFQLFLIERRAWAEQTGHSSFPRTHCALGLRYLSSAHKTVSIKGHMFFFSSQVYSQYKGMILRQRASYFYFTFR